MSDNTEISFEEQLKQEEEEKKKLKMPVQEPESNEKVRIDDDGTEYEWNETKHAWFPKISEDFIAMHHMSYGSKVSEVNIANDTYNDNYNEAYEKWKKEYAEWYEKNAPNSKDLDLPKNCDDYAKMFWNSYQNTEITQPNAETTESSNSNEQGKKRKNKPNTTEGWFEVDLERTTQVYVTGLPVEDFDEEQFLQLMNKCGLITMDPLTKKLKVKLYRNENGQLKGDGLCSYIKPESVDLALQILHEYEVRPGYKLTVEKAKFSIKGDYDTSKKRKKLSNKEKRKHRERQEKLFGWKLDQTAIPLTGKTRKKSERVIIINGVFKPSEFTTDPSQILTWQDLIRSECSNYGSVKKVTIYDMNEDGIISVTMDSPPEADLCIQKMNKRLLKGRMLHMETWDGKTKYSVAETETDIQARDKEWEKFLQEG